MRTAVITVAARRNAHLRNQIRGLAMSSRPPEEHVVVAMGDQETMALAEQHHAHGVWMDVRDARLPLAAARNLGARTAIARGAELLVFLDVDCIPDPAMIDRYRSLATAEPLLLCGPVTYLPPAPPGGYHLPTLPQHRDPHPARPDPPAGTYFDNSDFDLFWSLSFALTADTWRRIGGFCTRYRGYGGEDTDFAYKAAAIGARLRWAGGADAYHQHHPVSDPPIEHLADILSNATVFHRRWGRWPMLGWLESFAASGHIAYDPATRTWHPLVSVFAQ
ncbi:glycosyltransferase family 2 protein [Nocardia sp. NPDC052316]|uniref:glycosyltransferase family 2 protein n=1 Tax=Nocardia sp. NPDC052316 TaxID=3364329 RepID=UPI0037C50081